MDKWLTGNGYWCPACNGTGRGKVTDAVEYSGGAVRKFHEVCSHCKGQRRLEFPVEKVVALASE